MLCNTGSFSASTSVNRKLNFFASAAVSDNATELIFFVVADACKHTKQHNIYKNCVKRICADGTDAYNCEKCKNNCEEII